MRAQDILTSDRNAEVYNALSQRNRLIGWLRILVPLVGLLVLVALVVQIVIANLASGFQIEGVRLDKGALVIDAPEYSGIMANGTQYTIVAEAASAAIGNPDIVNLSHATLDLLRTDGYQMQARAENARFSLVEQTVYIEEMMQVDDSRGMQAQVRNSTIDWAAQTLTAKDNVYVTFTNGTILTGSSLVYNAGTGVWDFSFVKLTLSPDIDGAQ